MKIAVIVFAFCLITNNLFSQTRNEIRDLDILSVKEIEVDYEDSNGKEVLKFETFYDNRGNVIKELDYDKSGNLTEIITYEYNEDDNKTKEIHYKPNNTILNTFIYSYDKGLLTERKEYDKNNKLISRNTYKYENRLRTERNEYDESNRLIEKKKYIYKFKDQ
jgi:antitoxin component YwqK of YwqJK toxin-antitoxin module